MQGADPDFFCMIAWPCMCSASTAWRLNNKGAGVQDAETKSPTHECCCNIFAVCFVVRNVLNPSMFVYFSHLCDSSMTLTAT